LQLSKGASVRRLVALLATLTATAAVRSAGAAEATASHTSTYFRETSSANKGVTVYHPQTDLGVTFNTGAALSAGYSVDIVSGATPRTFGVDTISGASPFSDTRHELRGGLGLSRSVADISVGYIHGWESDYKTQAVTVTTRSDILDRAFTLGASFTHNFDSVCDQNNANAAGLPLNRLPLENSTGCFTADANRVTHKLSIDTLEPSVTWAATPRLLLQAGGTLQILDGFQANPYRRVRLGSSGRTPQESLPDLRQRYALFGRAAYAMPGIRASVQGTVRAYRDTWAVEALTTEMGYHQYLVRSLLVSLRARFHSQRPASFYRDARDYESFGPNGQYWTGDRELSPMSNYLLGWKIGYIYAAAQGKDAFLTELDLAGKMDVLFYRLENEVTPNFDRKRAFIWQLAISARF
jgi:hypothetical protein